MWRHFSSENPYAGFDPSPYPDDLQGWGSDDPIFAAVIDYVRPRLIVEVGTWKGRSAINMARLCRERGLATQIVCIDTWLGTIESYTWRDRNPMIHDSLRLRHGWPQIYYQFLANVVRHGFQDMITPLAQTSEIGARLLAHHKIVPDLIYIDASHDYADVYRDIVAFFNLLRLGGVLLGDDYLEWEGVTRAVNEIAAQSKHPVWGRRLKYVFLKGGDPRAIPGLV
jgi:Methyltransferase domain